MDGKVVVLEPAAYEAWLTHGDVGTSLVQDGAPLYRAIGSAYESSTMVARHWRDFASPSLAKIRNVDEACDSIVPGKDCRWLHQMPSFQGRINEEQLLEVIDHQEPEKSDGKQFRKGGQMSPSAQMEIPNAAPAKEPKTYLTEGHTLKSWLLTTDHKRIGLLYLYSIVFYFAIAAVAAALMRIELITPAGDLVTSETYNKLFTIHGTLMVWFFLIPSIPAVLGNFVLPMMLGARDVAFPKLNLLSWYIFNAGGALALYCRDFWRRGYRVDILCALQQHLRELARHCDGGRDFYRGLRNDFDGLEFHRHRSQAARPGHDVVSIALVHLVLYATSVIMVLATPVLAMTLALMSIERLWGVGIFDPDRGRPRVVPAPVLVLLAPGRVHHDFAGDGSHQ